ncbi:MAG: glycosyltransferase [Ignavibacteriales bacterium]|nr:glycosyltransferase [Ignavibacteriales bacterium]
MQMVMMGLLGEVTIRTYFESQNKPTYVIKEIREKSNDTGADDSAHLLFSDRGCHVRIYEEAAELGRRGVSVKVVTYPLEPDPPGISSLARRAWFLMGVPRPGHPGGVLRLIWR